MNATPIYDSLVLDRLEADIDLDVLEALDFDEPKACEHPLACDREATVFVVHNCCGFSYLFCARHARGLLDYLALAMTYHRDVMCRVCGREDAPFPTITSLRGGA